MLVLTRKRAESIKIGNDIVIKVIQMKSGTVKLGIEAPSHVRILRAELTEFAAAPVTAAVTDGQATTSDADHEVDADSVEEEFDFSLEYSAEVEDEMLCVASD